MERLTLDETKLATQAAAAAAAYPGYSDPCPGSRLQIGDDIEWFGFAPGRVIWGTDNDAVFNAYAPEMFGDIYVPLDIQYVTDRAPVDPEEEPMPLYDEPQQQLAQQPDAKQAIKRKPNKNPSKDEIQRVLRNLLKTLPPANAKRARAYIRKHRADIELPDES